MASVCNASEDYEGAVPCQLVAGHAGDHMWMLADLSGYITWERNTAESLPAWAAQYARHAVSVTMAVIRRAVRIMRAVLAVAKRHIPWLAVVFTACLIIPGPFDEIAALAVVFVYAAFKPAMRAELAIAFRTK